MEIITGGERRRRWSLEEKLRIVGETEQPGSRIAEVGRRYEISRGVAFDP
jgi:transposase